MEILLSSKPALDWGLESASLGLTPAMAAARERCERVIRVSSAGAELGVRFHHDCREQSTRSGV